MAGDFDTLRYTLSPVGACTVNVTGASAVTSRSVAGWRGTGAGS